MDYLAFKIVLTDYPHLRDSGIAPDGTLYCCCDRREALHFGRCEIGDRFEELWRGSHHREALGSIDLRQCPDGDNMEEC